MANGMTDDDASGRVIVCVPGDCIARVDESTQAGDGTYVKSGHIHASIAGTVRVRRDANTRTVEVCGARQRGAARMPSVGSVVTCKVVHVNASQVRVAIHCVDSHVLRQPFRGLVRKVDVRDVDKDGTEIHKCFRAGDLILAKVLGMADNNAFLLSTAESELGVAVTFNEAGVPMVPISWTEVMCPNTFAREMRKVAKIARSMAEVQISDTQKS